MLISLFYNASHYSIHKKIFDIVSVSNCNYSEPHNFTLKAMK